MNELQDKFGSKGLTVLGVTGEGKGPTEKWIDEKDARYAYTYDKAGLGKELGVSGIPAAFLVDATGTIVWQGHPASLTEAIIEQNLEGVLSLPLYEWPKEASKAKRAFIDGKFSQALDEANDLAEANDVGKQIKASIQGVITGRMAKMEAALNSGDILGAYTIADGFAKGLKGLPEEELVKATLKKIASDKQSKAWLKDQKDLVELKGVELRRQKDCDEVIKDLEKLLKGNEGSFVGNQIEAYIKDVKKLRSKLN